MKNLFLTTTICLIGLSTLAQKAVQGQDEILSSLNNRNLKYISSQEFLLKRNLQFNQPFLSILVIQDSIDFKKGYIDGGIYYRDTGPFWGGFTTGLFTIFAVYPIIVTIGISKTPPRKLRNPKNPNNALLLSNLYYYVGFQSGAHKIKSRKTWTGFGFGAGVGTVFLVAIIVLFSGVGGI